MPVEKSLEPLIPTSSEAFSIMSPDEAQRRMISQLERIKISFIIGGDRVAEMHEIDGLYNVLKKDGSASGAFTESTARGLFFDKALFDNLHFQSSLLTSRSTFFGDILRKMGDLVDREPEKYEAKATLPVHIRLVEHYCRKKGPIKKEIDALFGKISLLEKQFAATSAAIQQSKAMYGVPESALVQEDQALQREWEGHHQALKLLTDAFSEADRHLCEYVHRVERKISDAADARDILANAQLGKVRYEEAMDERDNMGNFDTALALGEQSVQFCRAGKDLFGELTARGNAVCDTKTKWGKVLGSGVPESMIMINEAREGLAADVEICWRHLLTVPKGSFEEDKFLRVWVNSGLQLVDAAVQQGDLHYAEKVLDELKGNSLFVSQRKSGAYQECYDMVEGLRKKYIHEVL